jgi:hypothetical protein
MLELWLLPGGHNLLHYSYFSIAVSAWFEITPGVNENTERNAKQKVTIWLPNSDGISAGLTKLDRPRPC